MQIITHSNLFLSICAQVFSRYCLLFAAAAAGKIVFFLFARIQNRMYANLHKA